MSSMAVQTLALAVLATLLVPPGVAHHRDGHGESVQVASYQHASTSTQCPPHDLECDATAMATPDGALRTAAGAGIGSPYATSPVWTRCLPDVCMDPAWASAGVADDAHARALLYMRFEAPAGTSQATYQLEFEMGSWHAHAEPGAAAGSRLVASFEDAGLSYCGFCIHAPLAAQQAGDPAPPQRVAGTFVVPAVPGQNLVRLTLESSARCEGACLPDAAGTAAAADLLGITARFA